MRGPSPSPRSFERAALGRVVAEPQADNRKFFYQRLMQVTFHHTYYNSDERFACPDFQVAPTPYTAQLMRDLGLLFRDEGVGFSVLYDERRKQVLLRNLRRQAWPHGCAGEPQPIWERLSFVLKLDNPNFVNFTNIPIDTSANRQNYYYTNQRVREDAREGVRLAPRQRLPVVPPDFEWRILDPDVWVVQARAISGKVALCKNVCLPRALVADHTPNAITCACVEKYRSQHPEDDDYACSKRVVLEFSMLPQDKYVIEQLDIEGRPVGRKLPVLYTATSDVPMAFVDLLFTRPTPGEPGKFPIVDLCPPGATRILPVHYQIWFDRRSTRWNYYIVPQPQTRPLDGLEILSTPPSPVVEFSGPDKVFLANGQLAFRFTSRQAVPLQQRSTYRFELSDQHCQKTDAPPLVKRLPVAGTQQVLPVESRPVPTASEVSESCSDIFVYV